MLEFRDGDSTVVVLVYCSEHGDQFILPTGCLELFLLLFQSGLILDLRSNDWRQVDEEREHLRHTAPRGRRRRQAVSVREQGAHTVRGTHEWCFVRVDQTDGVRRRGNQRISVLRSSGQKLAYPTSSLLLNTLVVYVCVHSATGTSLTDAFTGSAMAEDPDRQDGGGTSSASCVFIELLDPLALCRLCRLCYCSRLLTPHAAAMPRPKRNLVGSNTNRKVSKNIALGPCLHVHPLPPRCMCALL